MNFLLQDNFKSVQVISTIIQGSIIEYVAYQAVDSKGNEIKDPEPIENKPDDGDKTTLYVIIGVSIFLVVVVIVLILVIYNYNSKNKDLLNKVNKISFVQSGANGENGDENSDLLIDDAANALD